MPPSFHRWQLALPSSEVFSITSGRSIWLDSEARSLDLIEDATVTASFELPDLIRDKCRVSVTYDEETKQVYVLSTCSSRPFQIDITSSEVMPLPPLQENPTSKYPGWLYIADDLLVISRFNTLHAYDRERGEYRWNVLVGDGLRVQRIDRKSIFCLTGVLDQYANGTFLAPQLIDRISGQVSTNPMSEKWRGFLRFIDDDMHWLVYPGIAVLLRYRNASVAMEQELPLGYAFSSLNENGLTMYNSDEKSHMTIDQAGTVKFSTDNK